ncbi:3'-5' exoribonuclease HELZ2-like isoform X2 [Babylonia areolata]|uniref:3'-5' exoribonuclease HELZ2-like isoform X2 n=1 Tax=Babylonia areolata TaxID=304850 RepID=UPI003FD4EFE2
MLQVFKEYVTKAEEALRGSTHTTKAPKAEPGGTSTGTGTEQTPTSTPGPPVVSAAPSEEWLAETNALKTEKQRKAALKKMPNKKKAKNPTPVVSRSRDSSDSDVDSDSSNLSEDTQFASNYASVKRRGQAAARGGRPAARKGSNVVQVNPSEPDQSKDVLHQNLGFKRVGDAGYKNRANGMGLDDFSMAQGHGGARPKTTSQYAVDPSLPPVNTSWPLEDSYQFRLACRICFIKTGEGYKGYTFTPNLEHRCDKDVLVIRRKDNQSLNWIKIRPMPPLLNNRFSEFKMCQQFVNAMPCKIGEQRCTFPHNNNEKNLWYKEREGTFSHAKFMDELHRNGIDNSEQLAAHKAVQKTVPKQIPGLNFKSGSRQRLSSPAPIEQRPPRPPSPSQRMTPPPRPPAPVSVTRPPPSQPPPSFQRMPVPPQPLVTPAASPYVVLIPPVSVAPVRPAVPRPPGNASWASSSYPHQPPPQLPSWQQPKPAATAPSRPASSNLPSLASLHNSLKDYDYKIVCPVCFKFENSPGRYSYNHIDHVCDENVLAVKNRNSPSSPWMRVRERTNHRDFPGKYIMCKSITSNNPKLCRYGEFECSFAHNEAEQRVWGMEKWGKFSITDFILQNRKAESARGFSAAELLKKYGGFFTNVCRKCFFGRPPRVSEAGPNNTCNGTMEHQWDKSLVLAHVDTTSGELTVIDKRKFTHKGAFFRICKFLHFCQDQLNDKCLSAHGFLERDVWMFERDTNISRAELIRSSQERQRASPPQQPPPPQNQQQAPPQQRRAWGGAGPPRPGPPSSPSPPKAQPAFSLAAEGGDVRREKVPYPVEEFCGMCWVNGTRSPQDGTTNKCTKGHPNFMVKRVFIIMSILKELRNLPNRIPSNLNFVICNFIQQRRKCQFTGPGPCQFAHSNEERVLWIWMARNQMHKLEDVVKACREDTKKAKITQGDSVVSVTMAVRQSPLRLPTNLQNNAHYCRYCSVQCNSERQWEEHCASEKHMFNVNSDKDHQWNFRQPPWGLGSNLAICFKHMDGGGCQYSHAPDMFNLCKYAHSQEELDEWRERYEWRQMKRTLAKEQNMFSYMDNLLEQYNSADSQVNEMSETLAGVQVKCKQPLEEFRQEKNAVIEWTFLIQTQLSLQKVALLHHSARLHFFLQSTDGSKHQIASGEQFEDVDEQGNPCYRVSVHFTGGMFGSFSQWVVFDFGTKPVLLRKLNVELGHEAVHEKVKDLRQKLAFDRWTKENREVIAYHYSYDDTIVKMLQQYKEPASEVMVTQDSIKELNQHNYVHKMHKMLHLEEMTRHKLISTYNLINMAEVKDTVITELHGTYHTRNGELFLRLPLTENLTDDTGAGKLIVNSVKSVLLTRADLPNKHRVYEAHVLPEGRGKDFITVRLSPVCVRELKLKSGMDVEVEVQFQMNRMKFIKMHYALDLLTSTDIVFPDITKINPLLNEHHTLKVSSRNLNSDQMQAVRFIVAERTGYTPPFIMFGPFGTGKTETLAQAAMVLLKEKSSTRILICAQSNSAANLYVAKYLDPYLTKANKSQLLLRIVAEERFVENTPPAVRKYCCLSRDGTSFEIPDAEVIGQHRIIITTVEMALTLTIKKLKGAFTHIFIDEAAQALECETIMPLTLATDKTCVVLTGDHLQISPKVYSVEARRQNFGKSMLERLHDHYFQFYHQLQKIPRSTALTIFLTINYRTKKEILRFISAVFYGGPEKLTASGSIPSVVELTPLLFYAVQGREMQEHDSISFHNLAESSEVVERVMELLDNWPQEWGKKAPEEISVVTPYLDQVKQIRYILKTKRNPDLRRVNVETVQNIQGKEFRALFISTVRTRNLLDSEHVARALKEADAVGDVADFAFLSDCKLLNTAMTRTKSLVAVVGDPVALCAIGDCIQIWRTYLKHCHNMGSIHPRGMTYESIRIQVVQLQVTMNKRLKEVAELCNPTSQPSTSPLHQGPASDKKPHTEEGVGLDTPADKPETAAGVSGVADTVMPPKDPEKTSPAPLKSLKPVSKVKFTKPTITSKDKATELSLTADEILLQLAGDLVSSPEPRRIECVRVVEEKGHAVASYDPSLENEDQRRKMTQASGAGKEFDSDEVIYEDTDRDSQMLTQYFNYSESTLQDVLLSQPDHFKLCTIHIHGESCIAKVLNPQDHVQEVEVRGSLHRGRAFDKDEVVVEILGECEGKGNESKGVHGRVVGIWQRAINSSCRSFVCSVNPTNMGMLSPINPGVPSIYNVLLPKDVQRVKKGFVCVYQLADNKTLTFSHYEKVEANATEGKLFVVRYLKWLPGFSNPIGIVVGVLPAGHDLTSALNILDIEYHLPTHFSSTVMQELQSEYPEGYSLPAEVYSSRTDITTTTWCFTIDSPQSTDIQVAFSIDQLSDTSYRVCVHVTDVAHFMKKDSALDREALQRGTAILPIGRDPVPLVPKELSSEVCSLRVGRNSCALSVFMTVTGSGEEWHVVQTAMDRTIVTPKQHFSFEEVEKILDDVQNAENDYMKSCILVLYQITHMRRKQRKGNAHLDSDLGPVEAASSRAHHLMQELLLMANSQVADQLVQVFPQCTPLLQEAAPNQNRLEEWKAKHAADAINSVALTKPFLEGSKVCTCRMVCMCVFGYMRDQEVKPLDHFDVVTVLWNQALAAAPFGYTHVIQKVVATPTLHPQTSVALKELQDIIPPQQFVCSGDVDPSQQGHYRLNLPCFTAMTSPLHSYIGIMVQRLMTAIITDDLCPYTQPEVTQLAAACNHSQQRADSYTAANALVHLATSLQSRPLTLFPVLEKVDGQKVLLHFPNFPSVLKEERTVSLTSLQLSTLPQVSSDGEQVKVTWQGRIYDASPSDTSSVAGNRQGAVELCADSFVSHVPPFHWQTLLTAVREENEEKLLKSVPVTQEHISSSMSEGRFAIDVSSEPRPGGVIHHFSEFSLSLHTCMVLQIQVTAELLRGLLCPRLQLIGLTPTLDLCLEHYTSPAECFTKLTSLPAAPNTHVDEAAYQQCWMPILSLEAVETAVHSQASATIHNVFVEWKQRSTVGEKGEESSIVGKFSLSQSFCKERAIFFSGDAQSGDNLDVFGLEGSVPVPHDLLCVRYKGLEMPEQQGLDERVVALVSMGSSVVSWVGHCMVHKVKHNKKGMVSVQVRLQSSTVEMPAVLLNSSVTSQVPCTVEWVPKTTLCRQMEHSVACLTSASDLAKDIAVGRKPFNSVDQSDVGFLVEKISQQLNAGQKEAVHLALKQPFTVIQGPPGSGKTFMASHLASLYVERNRMTPQPASHDMARAQVLICASSDTAVDVIAAHLKSLSQTAPRMVRVYDEVVECVDFPVPRSTISPNRLKMTRPGCQQLQKMALHHLIRSPPNSFYKKIQEFDLLFGLYPNDITDDQIEEYQHLVLDAQLQELQQAEVILATCSAAATPRMAVGTNIKQIIVDSCESCMEVESLVPVILKPSAQQLVLVGDPRQLQPAVCSPTARSLGLCRSLLERYSDSAVRLKEQYRMHLGISEVSSLSFYNGQLRVMTRAQQGPAELDVWPSSQAQPLAFCHVEGLEETVPTLTENGVKESFSNEKEADAVASIVEGLLVQSRVGEGSVVVVSQYLAHSHLIQQYLSNRNIKAVDVRSVSHCQGCDFDYVVLSTCRSLPRCEVERRPSEEWLQRHLGPLADMHQINVALTRARKGLIITGNKHLLESHSTWSNLLEHFRKHKALVDVDHFIHTLSL